jgi:hypothetical protein
MSWLWALSCRTPEPAPPQEPAFEGGTVALHPELATVPVIRWRQLRPSPRVWLSWRFEGEHRSSPAALVEPGLAHTYLLGLPAGAVATDLVLHAELDGREQTLPLPDAVTGSLPAELLEPEAVLTPRLGADYLLTSVDVGERPFYGPCYTVILDRQGRIVWYRRSEGARLTWQPKVSRYGGYLLIDELPTYALDDEGLPVVTRLTLDLAWQQTTTVEGMMLAFDELEDGSLVHDERETDTAFHLTRQHPDGRRERLWSCGPWLAVYTPDWWACATNTVLWSPERQTVLWSTFRTDLLLELDLGTGALLHEVGPFPGGLEVVPPASAPHEPHGPTWSPAGTLVVSTHDESGERQLIREFELDEAQGVLRELWSHEGDIWAEYGGQAQLLPDGHLLWQLGTAGVVQELTREGEVLWQVQWPEHLVGHVTLIDDLYGLLSP